MRRFLTDKFRPPPALIVATALSVVLAGAVVVSGIAIASAWAKSPTITLQFFLKNTLLTLTDASGRPVALPPKAGDVITETDLAYVGNHKHHAERSTASDHLRCVVRSPGKLVCDGQVTIGSSKLLAKHATATQSQAESDLQITGGTGKYRGYHGKAKFAGPSHSDLTIVVHR
jgi:hypothetical protein